MKRNVFIIILNWNGYKDTIECVESVRKALAPGYSVLVVDNGSTDGSEEAIRSRFPDLEVLQTGANLGFAGGNNVGIRHALGRGAEHIILLNNDTVVDPGFAVRLVAAVDADPSVGMASSKIYFHDRPDVIWYAGATLDLRTGRARHVGYGEQDRGQHDREGDTDRACGCSMLVTRQACERLGLLDPDYFCYAEDADWSVRAKKSGFRVVYVPASKVWHKVSLSTGGVATGNQLYYTTRNNLRLAHRHEPLGPAADLGRDLLILGRIVCSLFTMRISKAAGIRNIFSGARDFRRGRFGKRD